MVHETFPEIQVVGVAGLVGSCRTETMRALFGADPKIAGSV